MHYTLEGARDEDEAVDEVTRPDNDDLVTGMEVKLNDSRRNLETVQEILDAFKDNINESNVGEDQKNSLDRARTRLKSMEKDLITTVKNVKLVTQRFKSLGKKKESLDKDVYGVKFYSKSHGVEKHSIPIITMESVRVALRRLDFGERALTRSYNVSQDSVYSKTTVVRKRKCWVCKGDHLHLRIRNARNHYGGRK